MSRPTLACLLAGGCALLPAIPARAQDASVDPITITAARLPAPLTRTPDAHVVTEERIEARQGTLAADVLTEIPGVSFSQNGAFGGVASVRLRGAPSDKTLVLIDGVPVNDPSAPAGGFDFSSMDLGDIRRIEVLTGPQGSLWGSDAIGGVIAFTSREPDGVRAAAEGGSLATWRAAASIGRATDRYALGLSASSLRTAGISKADARDGNRERDGFNTATLALSGRLSLTDAVTLDARARYNGAATEYDGFGGSTGVIDSSDRSEAQTLSGYVRVSVKGVLGLDHEARVDLMDLDRRNLGAFPFRAAGDQQVYRWSAQRQNAAYGLAVGLERRHAAADSGGGRRSLAANGAYAIGRWSPVPALDLTVSVRRDDPDRFRGQTTARAAVSYRIGGGFTLSASAGQGFKTPSIYQATYPCLECARAGPARLTPERAEGMDAGVAWRSADGAIEAQATLFDLTVTDQIDYRYPVGYLNIARVQSAGLEVAAQARLSRGWSVRASYAHDDAVDAVAARALIRVPRDSGTGSVGWRGAAWQAELGVRAQGLTPDSNGPIRPFTVGYATASFGLTRHLTATARVENLGGVRYQQAYGYGEPGRTVMVGLRWR